MAATSTLTLRVKTVGERSIDSVTRKLLALQAKIHSYGSISSRSLEATNVKWKKHFDSVDKGIKAFGGALTKFVTMSAKFAALQVGALGVAMMAVHAAFVLGNAAVKAFQFLATGAAGAAAGLAAAASIAAAAVREQQIAMYSYKGGNNYQNASVAMRALAADADLATVGAANLNAVFAEVSKTSTFSAGSQNLLKGLMDFASAGKPLEEGAKSAGKLIAAMQDPKGSFSKMKEAAKELGPEMEKAISDLGITSADELKKAIMNGTLSAAGGVDGQFKRVNDTLVNRFKSSFALIKNDFADFGDPLLAPTKKMFEGVVSIFNTTFARVAGDIAAFAQGGMFDDIEGVIGKMADFFVNFIRDYLPKVEGMFGSLGSWWDRFKEGWNMVLEKLRPLIEGARVFEETLMRVLRPIGASLSEAFGGFNEQVVANADKFYEFGDAIGRFIVVMSKYAGTVRDIFIDALPFITKIVDGLTGIVDMFMSLLGGFRDLMGGGGMGSFMLIAKLLVGGRAMKKTTGGVLASYGLRDTTQARIDRGPLTGQTAGGNVTEGGKARAERIAKTAQAVNQQRVMQMSVQSMTVMSSSDKETTRSARKQQEREAKAERVAKAQAKEQAKSQAQATRSAAAAGKSVQAALGNQPAAQLQKVGIRGRISAYRDARRAAKADFEANRGTIKLPQYDPVGPTTYADRKNTWFNRNFRMSSQANAEMREAEAARQAAMPGYQGKGFFRTARGYTQGIRQMRDSAGYKRIFGGDIGTKDNPNIKKGINNSMAAGMGASVALGVASKLMPEEAQGALALGSAVAMVNPLAGLAVGVVGGLVMGIRGATARKKKEATAMAHSIANKFATDTMGAFRDGIKDAIDTGNYNDNTLKTQQAKGLKKLQDKVKLTADFFGGADLNSLLNERGRASYAAGTGNTASGDFETGWGGAFGLSGITDNRGILSGKEKIAGSSSIEELLALDAAGQDVFDADKVKDYAKQQRMLGLGLFGSMTADQYEAAIGDVETFVNEYDKQARLNEDAFKLVTDYGIERIGNLSNVMNKSEEEVQKLADAIGLDLFDHTIATTDQIKKMGEAMINTKREMEIAIQDRFAAGTDVFKVAREGIEGREALDEGAFALRGQFNEGALDKKTALTFAENTRKQLIAFYKGDVGLADKTFNEELGAGGRAYMEGGIFEGMEGKMMELIGTEINQVVTDSKLGRASDASEFITSRGMLAGQTVGGDLAGLSTALAEDPATMNNLTALLERVDLGTAMGQAELQGFLDSAGLGDFGLKFETYIEPMGEAATALKDASAELLAAATALFNSTQDTRTPRGAIGDATSRNLGNTLSNHSAISGSIAGNRTITSGYRNYALGSLKSDHVTGRALDMVGDNLVSYRDKMTAAGGLAEFHGKGDTRHLHVVPPSRSLGDSMTAVSAVSSNIGASDGAQMVSNSNNFYITGSDPQEIANAVMAKMAMINKSNGERR
jgi:hypothetical protein